VYKRQVLYNKKNGVDKTHKVNYKKVSLEFLFILIAVILIYFGARWTITGGVAIAEYFNISELVIGLITIAIGTSLPEIAVVLTACRKKETSLALGNLIGSNIYNVCFILALTGLITPLSIDLSLFSPTIIYLILLNLASCLKYTHIKLLKNDYAFFHHGIVVGIIADHGIRTPKFIFNTTIG